MTMSELRQLKVGMLVRHKTKGWIGTFDGVTHIRRLFEAPSDSVGCRVKVDFSPKAMRQIASAENLEILQDVSLEDRHKANLAFFGREWKGVRKVDTTAAGHRHRVAQCWFCKGTLNNAVDLECVACGWILCQCGACGCGYGVCSRPDFQIK